MQDPLILHPLLKRASRYQDEDTPPRFPTALRFVEVLAQREANLTRLNKRLEAAEREVDVMLNRTRFMRFWRGEYKNLFSPAFQEEVERAIRASTRQDWQDLWFKTNVEIRNITGNKRDHLAQSWAMDALTLCKQGTPEDACAARLRQANHQVMEAHPLGEDRPEAHAANWEENDPTGYGTRLWIRRQRLETHVILRELALMDGDGALTCATHPSSDTHPLYEEFVTAYMQDSTPAYQPVPEAEQAWEARMADAREKIGPLGAR